MHRLQQLQDMGSIIVIHGLQSAGSVSCGSWAQLSHDMKDPPGSGIELTSPALQGRILIPGPSGKPLFQSYPQLLCPSPFHLPTSLISIDNILLQVLVHYS